MFSAPISISFYIFSFFVIFCQYEIKLTVKINQMDKILQARFYWLQKSYLAVKIHFLKEFTTRVHGDLAMSWFEVLLRDFEATVTKFNSSQTNVSFLTP